MTHADVHNALHTKVGLGLPTTLNTSSTGHLAHHAVIAGATDLGFPASYIEGQGGHTAITNSLTTWLSEATPGPRSAPGPRANASIPGYPASFTSTHSTYASLAAAVAAGGTGRKFQITGNPVFTASIFPHAGDEFWGDGPSRTITQTGGVTVAFDQSGSTANVKVMNLNFGAFVTRTTRINTVNPPAGWECGYNLVDGGTTQSTGLSGDWVHHNIIKNISFEGSTPSFGQRDAIFEDNEIGPSPGGAGNKHVFTTRAKHRHNRFIGQGSAGIPFLQGAGAWFDYNNKNIIFEWNISEDNNGAGVAWEANHWDDDTGLPGVFTNIVRYNRFQNNGDGGVLNSSSSFMEVYENTFIGNCNFAGSGEILLGLTKASQDPRPAPGQGGELRANHMRYNHIFPSSNRRGASYNVQDTVANYSAYVTNTKDNTWNFNDYHFVNVAGTNLFVKEATNMTWAQWKAGNISVGSPPSIAGPQDINSTAVQV